MEANTSGYPHWVQEGYVVLRGVYSPEHIAWLRTTCERILEQWRVCNPETGQPGGSPDATSLRHLNHPGYFAQDPDGLQRMLETIAAPKVLELCRELFEEEPLFRCTSLFMNPLLTSSDGNWHRDSQFLWPDEAEEQERIRRRNGVSDHIQLQVALVESDDIELVPGSHRRWDTPAEYAIRRAEGGANNRSNSMPGAVRIALAPGDAVGFNAYGLHRGRYHADRLRRTFMLTFTKTSVPTSDYFSHQPWFLVPHYLDGLSPEAARFFSAFIATYTPDWRTA